MDIQDLIEQAARDMGVGPATVRKWRQRGVPHRWRLPIIEWAADKQRVELSGSDFDRAADELRQAS